MKRKLAMMLLFAIATISAWAQSVINGTVVSASDGEPIIGATVKVKGASQGTVTDSNGKFSINVTAGKTLIVSYIGMQTTEQAAKNGMTVSMGSDDKMLEEVVVTAMGLKRSAKALGYSATQVSNEKLTETRSNDIMSGLAGKIAGVQISATSSDPGASNSVVIRGFSSLSGNNQPLYVIDGVPLENSARYSSDGLNSGYDFGNGANAVNPDDVESMTVLKGAAATALYGSRAANGVILITTKTGAAKERGIGVEYNGGLQWESVLRAPQLQNDFGMGWYGDKTDDENGSWGPAFDGSDLKYGSIYNNSQQLKTYKAIKNNIRDFFDTGFKYNNSVSFNGASADKKSTFFASLSQIHEDGIVPSDADSYRKYTFSARASHKVKDFTISTSLNYAYQKNNFVTTGQGNSMYNAIMQTPRDIAIVDLKDLSNPFSSPGYYYTPYGISNPYWVVENYLNQQESERFYGKFQFDYDFLKYFKATYRFGLDTSTAHNYTGDPNLLALFGDSYLGLNGASTFEGATGSTSQTTARTREINQDIFITFDMDATEDLHVSAIAGLNGNERKYSYLYAGVSNLTIPTWYNLGNSAEIPSVENYSRNRRLIGAYAQAELGWKNMLYLTATARNDWSSTLPSGNRSFFYPGVTASWLINEVLSDDLKNIINLAKVRVAWGKTGNDASPYMTSSVYGQASASSSGWGSSSFPFTATGTNAYTKGNTLGSDNLSPEMTTETEFGLNLIMFKNRLNIDASYYNRNSDKQIFSLDMDAATGYTRQNINLGKIRNRGIELLIGGSPIRTKDFEWELHMNWSKNWSKVISLPEDLGGETEIYGLSGSTGLWAIEGEELGLFKAYTSQKDDKGNIICDNNGLPLTTDEQEIIGSMNHKYTMGFGTVISYKGVSLSVDFDYRKGGLMYSRTKDICYFTGNAIQTAYNNRNPFIVPGSVQADGNGGYVENTTALTPTNIYNYWNNGGDDMDASYLVDKTYLKLRTVSLAWNLPKKWLAHTFLTDIKVSVFGNNLWLWTPKSNTFIDPELTSFGNDLSGNYGEYSANPSSRKIGFNVSVKF